MPERSPSLEGDTQTIDAVARHFAGERVEKVTLVAVGIVDAANLAKSK